MHILDIFLFNGDKSVIKDLKQNSWYPLYDIKTFNSEPTSMQPKYNKPKIWTKNSKNSEFAVL